MDSRTAGDDATRQRPAEVAVVLGTRSEAVALVPVVRALRRSGHFSPLVVSTGQQRDGLDQVLRPLGVRPDVDLTVDLVVDLRADLGRDGCDPGHSARWLAADAVERLGDLLAERRPDAVLVHGGSATAFGAALAARSEGIGVGHLGAGLRTRRAGSAPLLPEEANQRLIAPLARWHFAPHADAATNLVEEGIDLASITVTGTTGVDALWWAASLDRGESAFRSCGPARSGRRLLACLGLRDGDRDRLAGVATALRVLAADGVEVVVPLHPGGVSPGLLTELTGDGVSGDGVRLVPPLDYLDFVATLGRASLVVTDSGTIEEEAPALGRPVLVVTGENGAEPAGLVRQCRKLLAAGAPDEPLRPDDRMREGDATARVLRVLTRSLAAPRRRTPGGAALGGRSRTASAAGWCRGQLATQPA